MARLATVVAVVGAGVALAAGVGIADATTGPNSTRAPRILVPKAQGKPFTGRFVITKIDKRARISGGQFRIVYTRTKVSYLYGTLQLNTYDNTGRRSNFVGYLFPFVSSGGKLRAKVLSPVSHARIGSMTWDRTADPDVLEGTLTYLAKTYRATFKRTSSPAPILAGTPAAQVVPDPVNDGLGVKNSAYYGRYAFVAQDADDGANAGLYAPVVRAAAALTGDAPASGSLTLADDEGTPVGTVSLHRAHADQTVYLTDFTYEGDRHTAVARSESTGGPVVGTFTATITDGVVRATLKGADSDTPLTFKRTR